MAEWIQPLELEKIFAGVFAGNPGILLGIALIAMAVMAGYFRMAITSLIFMVAMFALLFFEFIPVSIYYLLAIMGALVIGFTIRKFADR